MRNRRSLTIVSVFFGCLLFLLYPSASDSGGLSISIDTGFGSKQKDDPPPHAPAHGYSAKHNYHYYPTAQVYFDVSRSCYFYLQEGSWKMSVSLPVNVRVRLGDHVNIEMDTDRPYTQFEVHKKKYPPGQMKKKKKKKWS